MLPSNGVWVTEAIDTVELSRALEIIGTCVKESKRKVGLHILMVGCRAVMRTGNREVCCLELVKVKDQRVLRLTLLTSVLLPINCFEIGCFVYHLKGCRRNCSNCEHCSKLNKVTIHKYIHLA